MQLVAVGTKTGHLVFIDFSDTKGPRVLKKCRIHSKAVKKLK
jgi:hypothetical protein